MGRHAHVVDAEDTSAVGEQAATAEGVVGIADTAAVVAVAVAESYCSGELEHGQTQSESVIGVGVGAAHMMGSASAEEVIDRHAAVAVAVVAERTQLGGMARNAVAACA